jgi:predicted dehydrogenase
LASSELTRPIPLALLGVGRWGRRILQTLSSIADFRLIRVFSRNPQTRTLVPEDCRVEEDWRAVCRADDVDGVVVVTPPALHAAMVKEALGARKAVFVEKPFTLSVPDAESLLDLARHQGAVLHVDHVDLRNPAWETAKIELGRMGQVVSIDAVFGSAGPPNADVAPRWDWGPHPLALCVDLLGAPERIAARRLSFEGSREGVIETVQIDLGWSGKQTAQIVTGNGLATRQRRCLVRTSLGSLLYDDRAPDKIVRQDRDGILPGRAIFVGGEPPLTRALRRFAAAIRTPELEWSDGELSLQVITALAQVDRDLGSDVHEFPAPRG